MSLMSNSEWVQVQRKNTYKTKVYEVLKKNGTLEDLYKITEMGMNLLLPKIADNVEKVLRSKDSIEDKSIQIANLLIKT